MNTISLKEKEKQALQNFILELEARYCEHPRVLLIGSKARGDSTPESDIDVLVILPREEPQIRRNVLTIASRVSLDFDVLLNPIVIGESRLQRQLDFSFYRNITPEAKEMVIKDGEIDFISGIMDAIV